MEDLYYDVINKAQSGLRISDEELSAQTGLSLDVIQRVQSGHFDAHAVEKIASILNLHAPGLLDLAQEKWVPKPRKLKGLVQFTTLFFGDMTVNAYLICDYESKKAVLFDTGSDVTEVLKLLERRKLELDAVFLTHAHADHIADLSTIQRNFPTVKVYIHKNEQFSKTESITEGDTFSVGSLKIEARKTSGHSRGGTTYYVTGLDRPVAIVGDALFAGSMGKAPSAYQEALEDNRIQVFSLPDNTIICPGHGPMTTVKEEKEHNPFFPEFKK